jgi:hypothetical protein
MVCRSSEFTAAPAWKIGSTPRQVTSGNLGAGQTGALARESLRLTLVTLACGVYVARRDLLWAAQARSPGPLCRHAVFGHGVLLASCALVLTRVAG